MTIEIVIAGAGIGGLTAALSLKAAGFERIRILEAAPDMRPLGVGLNVLPNAVRELAELGLLDRLAACAISTAELVLCNRYGSTIWSEARGVAAGYRWPQFSIQRRHLQHVLLEAVRERLDPHAIRVGARVCGFTSHPGERIRVMLEGGSSLEADLLIGADGIRSGVRAAMYPDEGPPPSNGLVMWRGTSWGKPFLTGRSMLVTGDETQRMVFYPIAPDATGGDRILINWVAARPDDGTVDRDGDWRRAAHGQRVLKHFADWRFDWLDVPAILHAAVEVYEYPMIDRPPLPRWTFGRATLLGDAAHAMYPMGSNGATQAIMDARVLAHALATHRDVDAALAAYEEQRRPAMTALQASNRQQGPEQVIALAHRRAPHGFDHVHDVISAEELAEISTRYATTGGFDVHTVNTRPSYGGTISR